MGTEGRHHLGSPKSLDTLVADLYRYVDQTYKRYVLGGVLIDPVDEGWIHDTMLAMANRYYRDPYALSIYTRREALAYPAKFRVSQGDPRGGEWGTYPGMLMMFGQMESESSPFTGS